MAPRAGVRLLGVLGVLPLLCPLRLLCLPYLLLAGLGACTTRTHPPQYEPPDTSTPEVSRQSPCSAARPSLPSPDAQGLCGSLVLPAQGSAPTIYFVLDRSGSMASIENGEQKYTTVNRAVVTLVRNLGNRARFGAAVFPDLSAEEADADPKGCSPGTEVFAPALGDSPLRDCSELDGPVTKGFARATALPGRVAPSGGTPIAATLERLRPTLVGLPGRTVVVLATDGAPNCNPARRCDAGHCIPNLDRDPYCDAATNCCEPTAYGPEGCLDDTVVEAISMLQNVGISTYVIGMPGSSPYADVLDRAAQAGGHARPSGHAYYDVPALSDLDATLASIGASAVLSCHLELEQFPPDPGYINVYLDQNLVPLGGPNGWRWSESPQDRGEGDALSEADPGDAGAEVTRLAIDLVGLPCQELQSGQVREVEVIAGCPTERAR